MIFNTLFLLIRIFKTLTCHIFYPFEMPVDDIVLSEVTKDIIVSFWLTFLVLKRNSHIFSTQIYKHFSKTNCKIQERLCYHFLQAIIHLFSNLRFSQELLATKTDFDSMQVREIAELQDRQKEARVFFDTSYEEKKSAIVARLNITITVQSE